MLNYFLEFRNSFRNFINEVKNQKSNFFKVKNLNGSLLYNLHQHRNFTNERFRSKSMNFFDCFQRYFVEFWNKRRVQKKLRQKTPFFSIKSALKRNRHVWFRAPVTRCRTTLSTFNSNETNWITNVNIWPFFLSKFFVTQTKLWLLLWTKTKFV